MDKCCIRIFVSDLYIIYFEIVRTLFRISVKYYILNWLCRLYVPKITLPTFEFDPVGNVKVHVIFQFDPALQRFMSMKVSQLEFFSPNAKTITFGVCAIILPMLSYGYLIWNQRTKRERDIRCGKIKYCDRLFKFN